jgi:schlafen family protein
MTVARTTVSDVEPEALMAVLDAGDFDQLVGTIEHQRVEFKEQPYNLETRRGLYELAKDVSGLANADGGVLVIGVRTRKNVVTRADVVDRIGAFARDGLDEGRYLDVLRARVYPTIENIEIEWKPSAADPGVGVYAIVIPPQPEERKFFLIRQPVEEGEEEEDRTPGYMVGLALRRGADVEPERLEDIYLRLRDGRNIFPRLDEIDARLGAIEEGQGRVEPEPDAQAAPEPLLERVEEEVQEDIAD